MKTNNIIKTNVDKSTKEGQKLTFNFLTGNHIKLSELEGKELEIKHYMIFEQTETILASSHSTKTSIVALPIVKTLTIIHLSTYKLSYYPYQFTDILAQNRWR